MKRIRRIRHLNNMSLRCFVRITTFLVAAAVVCGTAYLIEAGKRRTLENTLANNYRLAYYELVSSLESIDASLVKASVSSSPEMLALLSGDIWNKAESAMLRLSELPVKREGLAKTETFLNRVGNYSYSLAKRAGRSEFQELTDEERRTLIALSENASGVGTQLSSLLAYIGDPGFFEENLKETGEFASNLEGGMLLVETAFPETPVLIFDGPYSEHITGILPKVTEETTISRNDAILKVEELFEEKATFTGETKKISKSDIPVYEFALGEDVDLAITKNGGHIISYRKRVYAGEALINCEEAIEIAKEFLSTVGYSDMETSYYQIGEGVCYINFESLAAVDAGYGSVFCYPDLIQIGISLNDGSVLYMDAKGYLSNHCERDLIPVIRETEARRAVADCVVIKSSRLALIPTEGKDEILCYEFEAVSGEHNILVYINASDGSEEKLLILQTDENGTLTI